MLLRPRDGLRFSFLFASILISPAVVAVFAAPQNARHAAISTPPASADGRAFSSARKVKPAPVKARAEMQSESVPAKSVSDWRMELETEEPSAVFFDRDTVQTQTALLWSLRVWNERPVARAITLRWRVRDADGRLIWRRDSRLTISARGQIHRRELFEPRLLGAYRLDVQALQRSTHDTASDDEKMGRIDDTNREDAARSDVSRRRERDKSKTRAASGQQTRRNETLNELRATYSFAVVMAPSQSPGLRPRSFFALSTPALLGSNELDFYARIGARVLRSPWAAPRAAATSSNASSNASKATEVATAASDFRLLDRQMQARLERGLATRGVLPLDVSGRALTPLLVRYNGISVWEWAGRRTILPNVVRDARTLRPDSALIGPYSGLLPSGATSATAFANGWDGVVVPWPSSAAALDAPSEFEASTRVSQNAIDSDAVALRVLLGMQTRAASRNSSLYIAQSSPDADNASDGFASIATASSSALVTRTIISILSGAAGMSASLDARLPNGARFVGARKNRVDSTFLAPGDDVRVDDVRMARAAAFSTMTRLLEDTSLDSDLFPASPFLWGVSFQGAPVGDVGRVAVVWLDAAHESFVHEYSRQAQMPARLVLPISDAFQAKALDINGNEIARARNGRLTVSPGRAPIYVLSATRNANATDALWKRAWKEAAIEGVTPLAVQTLALTQLPDDAIATHTTRTHANSTIKSDRLQVPQAPRKPMARRVPQTIRVRVQNVLNREMSGSLKLQPPRGWMLTRDVQDFRLKEGESRVYGFAVTRSVANPDNRYPLTVEARSRGATRRWKQFALVATAQEVGKGAPRIDGNLNDWPDAAWMEARQNNFNNGYLNDANANGSRMSTYISTHAAGEVSARVALKWDSKRLYIAARVSEPRFVPRHAESRAYRFFKGFDALQIAFGLRDDASVRPQRSPFRDSDSSFLLSPFDAPALDAPSSVSARAENSENTAGKRAEAKTANTRTAFIGGRVLRLWNPALPPESVRDAVRWGGVAAMSQCVVKRDETRRVTVYEASIPLDAIPGLRPATRAARDVPIRFTWVLHNDEGPALQWSRTTGVFPWWSGADPISGQTRFAAQTPLGFSLAKSLDNSNSGTLKKNENKAPSPHAAMPIKPRHVAPRLPLRDRATALRATQARATQARATQARATALRDEKTVQAKPQRTRRVLKSQNALVGKKLPPAAPPLDANARDENASILSPWRVR